MLSFSQMLRSEPSKTNTISSVSWLASEGTEHGEL